MVTSSNMGGDSVTSGIFGGGISMDSTGVTAFQR